MFVQLGHLTSFKLKTCRVLLKVLLYFVRVVEKTEDEKVAERWFWQECMSVERWQAELRMDQESESDSEIDSDDDDYQQPDSPVYYPQPSMSPEYNPIHNPVHIPYELQRFECNLLVQKEEKEKKCTYLKKRHLKQDNQLTFFQSTWLIWRPIHIKFVANSFWKILQWEWKWHFFFLFCFSTCVNRSPYLQDTLT